MKSLPFKVLLSSWLLIYLNNIYSSPNSEQIQVWKKQKNYIVLSVPIKMYTLDPTKPMNAHTKFTLPLIFEPLISINAQQELLPVLAKSWLISTDRKSVIITIKSNHRFSDNSEVTPQDVVNSIYRLCSPGSRGFGELKALFGCEEHVKGGKILPQVYIVGKYDIKFNITNNPTTFLYQLSSPNTVITKKTKIGLIGSGPYTIKKQNENNITFQRNLFYSGDTVVNNDGLVMFYTSSNDVLHMLVKERPDGAIMYRLKELLGFNDKRFKLINSNPNITEALVLNNQRFPFNKSIVRRALSVSIYNHFNYSCIPGSHKAFGVIPTGIGGSIANMPPSILPEITPQKLFEIVPELKNQIITVIIHQLYDVKNDCESEQMIKIAKQYHINLQFKYHKEYYDLLSLEFNHNHDGFIDLYILKNREASNILQYFTKKGDNHPNIKSLDIDYLLKEANSAPFSHTRFQIYRKIAQYIQEKNIIIPIFYMDHGNLINKCVSDISNDFFFNPYLHLPELSKIKKCKN